MRDFYSYAIIDEDHPELPLGIQMNPHSMGRLIEDGLSGFKNYLTEKILNY